ncbi:GNAT family N-acetyltransferase [Siphonobacter sp.]|uniref:GNAT family N-acetyltransferase n=1 Tax=Siphonobacter sp. TaxID=1869184 RepID=UPI003B3A4387
MLNKTLVTFPTLTTERLTLRQLVENDVQAIFLLRSDPVINKYLDREPSQTLEEALQFIRTIQTNNLLYWAIIEPISGKLVGGIGLFNVSNEGNTCEIGYELLPDYQGQGFMNEAMKKVIAFAVDILGIKAINAFTHKANQPSAKLLQMLNFEQMEIIDESNPDVIVFRLLN